MYMVFQFITVSCICLKIREVVKNVRDFSLNLYLLMTKNETASLEKLPNFGILNFESCYGGGYFFHSCAHHLPPQKATV